MQNPDGNIVALTTPVKIVRGFFTNGSHLNKSSNLKGYKE
jgi:hypothetical protein